MKKTIMHPAWGQITYEENIWTGKKTVTVNGTALPKAGKNQFTFRQGEMLTVVSLQGNALSGATLHICGQQFELYPKPSVLDWLLSALPFVLVLIWGNSKALCSIIPVIGGAIGGGLGGLSLIITMLNVRGKPVGTKLLAALLAMLITFAVGAALGYIFLMVLVAASV